MPYKQAKAIVQAKAARYYERHREEILARDKAKRAAAAEERARLKALEAPAPAPPKPKAVFVTRELGDAVPAWTDLDEWILATDQTIAARPLRWRSTY